jgi:hypothetical protein
MNAYYLRHFHSILRKMTFLIILLSLSAQASWVPYTVQKNDQLGIVIQQLHFKKWLWGENGLVQKVYLKNKDILKSPNLLMTGEIIYLPQSLNDLGKGVSIYPKEVNNQKKSRAKVPKRIYETEFSEQQYNEKEKRNSKQEKRKALLRLGTIFSLMDRKLTDKTTNATATVKSDAIYGLFLMSKMPISEVWNIDSSLSYRKVSFASSTTRAFSVDSESFLKISVGGSKNYKHLNLGAGIIYEQLPVIAGVSATSIGVSSLNVLSPYINGSWNFHSWGKTNLELEFMAAYNLSSSADSISLESGFDTFTAVNLNRNLSKALSYSVVPFVQYGNKNTNTVKHSDLDLGMRLLLNWTH